MDTLDNSIIVAYFVIIIIAGILAGRKAKNSNLDDYFLGGRKIHWLALSMSGSVSNFDITGTMWMVSILATLGMRSIWHHWTWGFLAGAFFLAYMAKWIRQSNVRTAAEWMHCRFGNGKAATSARLTFSVYAVLLTIGLVALAYQGIGKFASFYIPLEHWVAQFGPSQATQSWVVTHEHTILACAVIGITTLYVL